MISLSVSEHFKNPLRKLVQLGRRVADAEHHTPKHSLKSVDVARCLARSRPVELLNPRLIKNRPCLMGRRRAGQSSPIQRSEDRVDDDFDLHMPALRHSVFFWTRRPSALREKHKPDRHSLNISTQRVVRPLRRPACTRRPCSPEIALPIRNDPYQTRFLRAA